MQSPLNVNAKNNQLFKDGFVRNSQTARRDKKSVKPKAGGNRFKEGSMKGLEGRRKSRNMNCWEYSALSNDGGQRFFLPGKA